jgi:hypothetical protein
LFPVYCPGFLTCFIFLICSLFFFSKDSDFKHTLKEQILKDQTNIYPQTLIISPSKDLSFSGTLRRTNSKSYDNNISLAPTTDTAIQQADSNNLITSSTSSDISSINNSNSNILDARSGADSSSSDNNPITESFNKLAIQSLAYNDQRRKAAELEKNSSKNICC